MNLGLVEATGKGPARRIGAAVDRMFEISYRGMPLSNSPSVNKSKENVNH